MVPSYTLQSYPGLKEFLQSEAAATLAVPVDQHGTLHAATLLFWNSEEPLALYFVTNRDSQKCQLLKIQKSVPSACVVGTSKGTLFTLQMRGTLQEASPTVDLAAYYQKRGNHYDDIADEKNMCLVFTPTWARFTDYSKSYDRHLLTLA